MSLFLFPECPFSFSPDDGGLGFSGVTVYLVDSAGAIVTSTTTDSFGNYAFFGVLAGQYRIKFAFAPRSLSPSTGDNDFAVNGAYAETTLFFLDEEELEFDGGLFEEIVVDEDGPK